MILLLGGTGETRGIALALAEAGYRILVSTATDNALDVGTHPNIARRIGRLTEEGMAALIKEEKVSALVDATHPFAVAAHETARKAAEAVGIAYLRFERPATDYGPDGIHYANSHAQAAAFAFAPGRPVLLTTGSRNLVPYLEQSRKTGSPLIARVLPHPESLAACREAGMDERCVIAKRGPFSTEENLEVIRNFNIGALVTKDSGASGGVPEKLEAARIAGCRVVMVRRPDMGAKSFSSAGDLIKELNGRPA